MEKRKIVENRSKVKAAAYQIKFNMLSFYLKDTFLN